MKKASTFFALSIILIIGCASPGKDTDHTLERDLRVFFTENLKKADSTMALDSIILVRIDTLTLQDKYSIAGNHMFQMFTEKQGEFKRESEGTTAAVQMMRLSKGLSNDLFQNSKEDMENGLEALRQILDSMTFYGNKQDSFYNLAKTADSIQPVNYQAVCLYQILRADKSIIKDTLRIFLTLDKKIIHAEDYKKQFE